MTDIGVGVLSRLTMILQVLLAYPNGQVDKADRSPSRIDTTRHFDPAEEEAVGYYRHLPPELQGDVVANDRTMRRFVARLNPRGQPLFCWIWRSARHA